MATIVTFYSYKGGTGRSMALANVAWILASSGQRVLAVDWDLEAPGLHHYFRPFLRDPDLLAIDVRGVIDFVFEYAAAAVTPAVPLYATQPAQEAAPNGVEPPASTAIAAQARPADWYKEYADIRACAIQLCWPSGEIIRFGERGGIDFVPAGRQGHGYAARVNGFDWPRFYEKQSGGAFMDAVRESMAGYDYVLIDSRTGVADTAGICTVQLPDMLVLCFTLNNQSLKGAAAIAASLASQASEKPILPVPMRVDGFERDRLDKRREFARKIFAGSVTVLSKRFGVDADRYWADVEIPYFPYYSYEEILAPFEKFSGSHGSMLPALERLTGYVTNNKVRRFGARLSETQRLEVVAAYEETGTAPAAMLTRKRPSAHWRSAVAATVLWMLATAAVGGLLWTVFAWPSAGTDVRQLVAYAAAHENDTWIAASVLGAIDSDDVPDAAIDVAQRLMNQPIPFAAFPSLGRLALDPAGRFLAGVSGDKLVLYDVTTIAQVPAWRPVDATDVTGVQFSPGGDRIMTVGRQAALYETSSGHLVLARSHPNQSSAKALATGYDAELARFAVLSSTPGGELVETYDLGKSPAAALSEFPDDTSAYRNLRPLRKWLSLDGKTVGVLDAKGLTIWKLPEGSREVQIGIQPTALDPRLKVALEVNTVGKPKTISIWNLANSGGSPVEVENDKECAVVLRRVTSGAGQPVRSKICLKEVPSLVALAPGGAVAAFAFDDSHITVLDTETLGSVREVEAWPGRHGPAALTFGNSQWLASEDSDGVARVWQLHVPFPGFQTQTWPDLRNYLRAASGGCVPPAARQQLYRESEPEAMTRFANCRVQRLSGSR